MWLCENSSSYDWQDLSWMFSNMEKAQVRASALVGPGCMNVHTITCSLQLT